MTTESKALLSALALSTLIFLACTVLTSAVTAGPQAADEADGIASMTFRDDLVVYKMGSHTRLIDPDHVVVMTWDRPAGDFLTLSMSNGDDVTLRITREQMTEAMAEDRTYRDSHAGTPRPLQTADL